MKRNWKIFFILSAILYLMLEAGQSFDIRMLIKILPIGCLFFFVQTSLVNYKRLLSLAIIFSALGDLTLAIDRVKYFIPGLAFFLIAHIFYIILFSKNIERVNFKKNLLLLMALFYSGYACAMAFALRGMSSTLIIPVYGYLVAITLMVLTSLFNKFNNQRLIAGATIFLVSDSIIAIDKFLLPIPMTFLWVMTTYYLAQYLIVTAFVESMSTKN